MKFTHLPNAGGLYDQNPDLIDRFHFIFSEQAKEQERQRKEDERKSKAQMGRGRGSSRPMR